MIALHLGVDRTRKWWSTVGRIGFNPGFIADVDAFLAQRPTTTYYEDIAKFDAVPAVNATATPVVG